MYDDSEVTCLLVSLWLEEHQDLEFSGCAYDRDSALVGLRVVEPDVVILDGAAHNAAPLRPADVAEAAPGAATIVYSGHPPAYIRRFAPGATDYVLKTGSEAGLVEALRRLAPR